jgi:hypothetical protein
LNLAERREKTEGKQSEIEPTRKKKRVTSKTSQPKAIMPQACTLHSPRRQQARPGVLGIPSLLGQNHQDIVYYSGNLLDTQSHSKTPVI